MYILIFGAIITAILNWIMVPSLGIAGGAAATSIACFAMMVPVLYFVFKLTKVKAPKVSIFKIFMASIIMGIVAYIIPKTTTWLFIGIFICIIVYFFALIFVRFFTEEDIISLRALSSKFGPLSKVMGKMLDIVEKIEFR